jgi:hypothetical protein
MHKKMRFETAFGLSGRIFFVYQERPTETGLLFSRPFLSI